MSTVPPADREERVVLSLDDAVTHMLEECRTVVPGMQALLGFQLVAVFSQRFDTALAPGERAVHIGAIGVIVVAIALVMTPAALHRQAEPNTISRRFLDIGSRLLSWSMLFLAAGITLDVYIVARAALGETSAAPAIAIAAVIVFTLLWLVLPRSSGLQRLLRG